jgi:VWFA-related protein
MSRKLTLVLSSVLALGSVLLAQQSPPPSAAGQGTARPATPAAQPAVQTPPLTFKVEVEYVEVDAIVTDKQGNVVRDLTRDDFEVYEGGKRQRIDLFSFIDVPVERAEKPVYAAAPIVPDVQTNVSLPQGRIFVLVLDDLHTYPARTLQVRRAARRFIEQNLGANDLVAVVHASGRADAGQDFTGNKQLLLAAVDKFMGKKLRSETLNRIDEYNRQVTSTGRPLAEGGKIQDPEEMERAYNARSMLDTIGNIAQLLSGVRGRRKAMVLFSEGVDYNIYDPFSNRDASTVLDDFRQAIGRATRANVAVYGVDPRGLGGLSDEGMEISPPTDADPMLGLSTTALSQELLRSQDSLRVLSDETGGFAVVNTNDFANAFDRIMRDQSSYYVLAYYPANDKRDGRYRKIEVKVNRPGLEVRARKGWVAPKGKPEAPAAIDASTGTSPGLREALSSPLPEAGLPMAVQAAAFKGPAPNASVVVAVEFGSERFKYTEQNAVFTDTLELSLAAVDVTGKIRGGDRTNVELKLRPDTRQAVENFGFRMMSRFDLPPGRYQLRVGGRAATTESVGTVYYDLEVPDFSKEPFSMSGLVLTSAMASLTPTGRGDDELKKALPAHPTTRRDFRGDDTIALFAEVYDNQAASPHRVDISTTLRNADDGRVLFTTEDERSSEELGGARGGYGYTARVPLKEIPPGVYVLRVEAKSRLSGSKPAARDVQIRVWPAPQPRAQAADAPPASQVGTSIIPVVSGPRSGVDAPRNVVARTEEEWNALWATLPLKQAPPKVTFTSTMAVAVFLGSRPTTGYSVEVAGLRLDGETLVVVYRERKPASGAATAQVLTSPYAVAGVPMHAGPVRFEKAEE